MLREHPQLPDQLFRKGRHALRGETLPRFGAARGLDARDAVLKGLEDDPLHHVPAGLDRVGDDEGAGVGAGAGREPLEAHARGGETGFQGALQRVALHFRVFQDARARVVDGREVRAFVDDLRPRGAGREPEREGGRPGEGEKPSGVDAEKSRAVHGRCRRAFPAAEKSGTAIMARAAALPSGAAGAVSMRLRGKESTPVPTVNVPVNPA